MDQIPNWWKDSYGRRLDDCGGVRHCLVQKYVVSGTDTLGLRYLINDIFPTNKFCVVWRNALSGYSLKKWIIIVVLLGSYSIYPTAQWSNTGCHSQRIERGWEFFRFKADPMSVVSDHYSYVIIASQITGVSMVYSTVCSGADQRKHQSSASLAGDRWISLTKRQLRGKCFHLITSSCWGTIACLCI